MESDIKILIVEEEVITSMYWANSLRKLNYTSIRTTTSGEKAIELSKSEHPDIVLMDIHLRGKLDGIETATVINSFCEVYFIFNTGYANEDFFRKIKTFKFVDYLVKPVLIEDINKLINKKRK
jgi:CheY-like chemotaxis protein